MYCVHGTLHFIGALLWLLYLRLLEYDYDWEV